MTLQTTESQLIQSRPVSGHGTEVLTDEGHAWRLAVERVGGFVNGTEPAFIVGTFKLGPAASGGDDPKVGALDWEDLTDRWRGSRIDRGADEPHGRPRVGICKVTLADPDGSLSPLVNYAQSRPGNLMRVGLVSDTDTRADGWLPLFTGLGDSWTPSRSGPRPGGQDWADQFVEVTLVETLSALARINENALQAVEGLDDSCSERVDRLLDAASWKYGFIRLSKFTADRDYLDIHLQSTDMAKPRVEELYLSADSTSMHVRSDVTGAALVIDNPAGGFAPEWSNRLADFSNEGFISGGEHDGEPFPELDLFEIGDPLFGSDLKRLIHDAESLDIPTDPEHLFNDIRYARVGGSQQPAEHSVSIGRFGRVSKPRNDLICRTDANALTLAQNDADRLGRTTIRVDGLQVTATGKHPLYTLLLAAVDIGNRVNARVRLSPEVRATVRSLTHEITPLRKGGLAWTTTYALDTLDLFNFPLGAILERQFT